MNRLRIVYFKVYAHEHDAVLLKSITVLIEGQDVQVSDTTTAK